MQRDVSQEVFYAVREDHQKKATLTSRLIDRPMRPLFPSWLRDDLQIVAATLSMDENVPPDVLAVTGASIATFGGSNSFCWPHGGGKGWFSKR